MKKSGYIQGYYGWGDSIYQYPFLKELAKNYKTLYLRTPFPQLFDTIPNIIFIRPPSTHLATCKKYMEKYETQYKNIKDINPTESVIFHYQKAHKRDIGMSEAFNNVTPKLKNRPIDWSIPIKPSWIKEAQTVMNSINTHKKICLIKLPSVRKEWFNIARVGKVDYFQYIVDKYKDEYFFISLGNKAIETPLGEVHGMDLVLENAEISMNGILALTSMADLVVGYHSFLIANGIATGTKTFCIFGGYIRPDLWIDSERMDMNKIAYVSPEPFCNCFNRHHKECNKEIPLEIIDEKLEGLLIKTEEDSELSPTTPVIRPIKKNLLISRIRAERCEVIADNSWINSKFNIFTVDHTAIRPYKDLGDKFVSCYQFPHSFMHLKNQYVDTQKKEIFDFCEEILSANKIDLVINSHPLHTYNTQMKKACDKLGIKCINTEMFCDSKMIFDWNGSQYTKGNEIYDFVNEIPKITDRTVIDYPKTTRQPQPKTISKGEFFRKYGLSDKGNHIVMLGQLMWDMSVIQGVNKECSSYKDYVSVVLENNPQVTFIVKPHPLDIKKGSSEFINICKKFPNTVLVNESLDSLFDIFDYFTSFSSTSIFEGLMRGKKFATMGFHFCNNDSLVYQMRVNHKTRDLDLKLKSLVIDKELLERYIYFICNYYTIYANSDKLFYRLTMDSSEYFKLTL